MESRIETAKIRVVLRHGEEKRFTLSDSVSNPERPNADS